MKENKRLTCPLILKRKNFMYSVLVFLHDFSCYEKVEGLSYLIFQCCFLSILVRTLPKEPSEILFN